MKRTNCTVLFLLLISALVVTGCDESPSVGPLEDDVEVANDDGPDLDLLKEVDSWSELSPQQIWPFIAESDSIVHIGLRAPGKSSGLVNGRVAISKAQRAAATKQVTSTLRQRLLDEAEDIPLVRIKIESAGQVAELRNLDVVEYVEPARFYADRRVGIQSDGCGYGSPENGTETISTGDEIGRALADIGVPEAWQRGADGDDVTVTVVGTGVSSISQLSSQFTDGQSGGRTLDKEAIWDDGSSNPWYDTCSHETRIIGNIAAPRDGRSTVGIAYKADIYSARVDNDVLLQDDSWYVQDAIRRGASKDPYRNVINMSLGSPYITYGSIENRIQHEYATQPVLMFGAAGTSSPYTNGCGRFDPGDVVFPANMGEVNGVTGLDSDGTPCSNCHCGQEVEFSTKTNEAVIHPYNDGQLANMGGSSHSTGVMSGLAALVWSKYPGWSRDQVVQRLREATYRSLVGQGEDGSLGWGAPFANCAVGGLCMIDLNGPTVVESPGDYTYTVEFKGNSVPVDVEWYKNNQRISGSGTSITVNYNQGSTQKEVIIEAVVTDQTSGWSSTDSKATLVRAADETDCPPYAIICM